MHVFHLLRVDCISQRLLALGLSSWTGHVTGWESGKKPYDTTLGLHIKPAVHLYGVLWYNTICDAAMP